MCDTQVLLADNGIWFAKNSDREPQEAQAVVRLPRVEGDNAVTVRTTYLEIPQVADRHAVILSKPCWIWGAEMGLNEAGVVIGNEAIFSRQRSLEPALLGMDLLRLGLERGGTADEALEVITALLQAHGQGGPAGHADKHFHYDSSFIIADPRQAWVLETAGRDWAARRIRDYAAISNALSLERDADAGTDLAGGSFRRHDTRLLPFFAASHQRRALSMQCLRATAQRTPNPGFADLATHLRRHRRGNEAPLAGGNSDICMHAAGPIRRSQTTGSMIVWLGAGGPRPLFTGTSSPCLSLYRPVDFTHSARVLSPAADRAPLWDRWEAVHRGALFNAEYRRQLRQRIAMTESKLFDAWMQEDVDFGAIEALVNRASDEILAGSPPPVPRGISLKHRLWSRPLPA